LADTQFHEIKFNFIVLQEIENEGIKIETKKKMSLFVFFFVKLLGQLWSPSLSLFVWPSIIIVFQFYYLILC
jgi:hypothetical protein